MEKENIINRLNGRPLRLLIGGSPCTYWSVAQKNNRETKADGLGWELFKNYLIAKEKFKPDYFLYENNKSAAQEIKDQISHELGTSLQYINSSLVSAQNRQRFYAHNIPNVESPADRGILLKDILEINTKEIRYELMPPVGVGYRNRREEDGKLYRRFETHGEQKSNALTTVQTDSMVAEPIRIGTIGSNSQAHRVYSSYGKSINIVANGGGQGAKTGLYAISTDNKGENVYEVRNGQIVIKNKSYPIKLPDGFYIIRKLTPIECERLQTLPDNYTEGISNTQRYKCLGNGWTAEVIIHILSHIDIPKDYPIEVLAMYDGIATGRYCLEKLNYTNITYKAYEIEENAIKIAIKNYPDIIESGDAFQLRKETWVY